MRKRIPKTETSRNEKKAAETKGRKQESRMVHQLHSACYPSLDIIQPTHEDSDRQECHGQIPIHHAHHSHGPKTNSTNRARCIALIHLSNQQPYLCNHYGCSTQSKIGRFIVVTLHFQPLGFLCAEYKPACWRIDD